LVLKNKMTLADQAYYEIEEKIISLELKPGSIVSENQISQLLGIGRMPVRLAFKRLETVSLVSSIPRKGILINEIKIEDAFLQLEVRLVLERLLVSRACKYASKEERERLLTLASHYQKATSQNNKKAALKIDDEFNHLLGKCSKNKFARKAILPLYALCRRLYFYTYQTDEKLTAEINNAHIDLMKAIAGGKETAAQKTLYQLHKLNERLILNNMSTWLPAEEFLLEGNSSWNG